MDEQVDNQQQSASLAGISVRKAVLIGQLTVNLPVVIIMLAFTYIGLIFTSTFNLIFLLLGFVLAWIWWSFAVPRWRRWALRRGAQPDKLQKLAVSTGLVWLKGSAFEKTEFKIDK